MTGVPDKQLETTSYCRQLPRAAALEQMVPINVFNNFPHQGAAIQGTRSSGRAGIPGLPLLPATLGAIVRVSNLDGRVAVLCVMPHNSQAEINLSSLSQA